MDNPRRNAKDEQQQAPCARPGPALKVQPLPGTPVVPITAVIPFCLSEERLAFSQLGHTSVVSDRRSVVRSVSRQSRLAPGVVIAIPRFTSLLSNEICIAVVGPGSVGAVVETARALGQRIETQSIAPSDIRSATDVCQKRPLLQASVGGVLQPFGAPATPQTSGLTHRSG